MDSEKKSLQGILWSVGVVSVALDLEIVTEVSLFELVKTVFVRLNLSRRSRWYVLPELEAVLYDDVCIFWLCLALSVNMMASYRVLSYRVVFQI